MTKKVFKTYARFVEHMIPVQFDAVQSNLLWIERTFCNVVKFNFRKVIFALFPIKINAKARNTACTTNSIFESDTDSILLKRKTNHWKKVRSSNFMPLGGHIPHICLLTNSIFYINEPCCLKAHFWLVFLFFLLSAWRCSIDLFSEKFSAN